MRPCLNAWTIAIRRPRGWLCKLHCHPQPRVLCSWIGGGVVEADVASRRHRERLHRILNGGGALLLGSAELKLSIQPKSELESVHNHWNDTYLGLELKVGDSRDNYLSGNVCVNVPLTLPSNHGNGIHDHRGNLNSEISAFVAPQWNSRSRTWYRPSLKDSNSSFDNSKTISEKPVWNRNILGEGRQSFGRICARSLHTSVAMAKSKFEYVKQFEQDDKCLPNCWIVIRIDGKSFHRFSDTHHFVKPNDERGLGLMSRAAQVVMEDFKDVTLAYGQSDEYSFVFKKHTTMYNRRGSKMMTNLVSLFSSAFVMNWRRYFPTQELQYPPSFDARVVLYPSDQNLKDYLCWRQADCHINNLYNTVFWKLVQEKCMTPAQAQERLKCTLSSDKNEILFADFSINYNNLPELYRKGTVLLRNKDSYSPEPPASRSHFAHNDMNHSMSRSSIVKHRPAIAILHCDIIGKTFWDEHPEVLETKKAY